MNWSAPAFILSARAYGERDVIASVLTLEHGRYAGLVRGGQSAKAKTRWQSGLLVNASWRARLSEHLGSFSGEAIRDYAAGVFPSPLGLATLLSACTLLDTAVPERMPLPDLYHALGDLLPLDDGVDDLARYVRFECAVLQTLGYGMDFSACALTGRNDDLSHVSPRTGRAVNRLAGEPWADKLLPLPIFLQREATASWDDIGDGLALSGHFIEQHVLPNLPASAMTQLKARRQRVLDLAAKQITLQPRSALAS
jgi:DNA repair protein RecO (recombination protein O)